MEGWDGTTDGGVTDPCAGVGGGLAEWREIDLWREAMAVAGWARQSESADH